MAEIVQLDQLLTDYLVPGKNIVDYSTENLTEAGDNYGSRMIALEVKIENEKKEVENLQLAAKMYPLNEWIAKVFHSPITFKKEIGLYAVIAEELKKLQDEHKLSGLLDVFPKYYGGRLSLDPEATLGDEAAVFLLENMKKSNYVVVDRLIGFDLKTSEIIVKDFATLHAAAIALRLKKPELFREKIMPLLEQPPNISTAEEQEKFLAPYENHILKILEGDEFLKDHKEKIRPFFKRINVYGSEEIREPFATIGHNDAWTNNYLVLFENEEAVKIKLIDFQSVDYGSPLRDLICFLFTSVQTNILEKNIDRLIDLYFNTFVKTLGKFDIDQDHKIYTRDEFEKELELEAKHQLIHIFILYTVTLKKRKALKEVGKIEEDDMMFKPGNMSEEFQVKTLHTISEFVKRNWI